MRTLTMTKGNCLVRIARRRSREPVRGDGGALLAMALLVGGYKTREGRAG